MKNFRIEFRNIAAGIAEKSTVDGKLKNNSVSGKLKRSQPVTNFFTIYFFLALFFFSLSHVEKNFQGKEWQKPCELREQTGNRSAATTSGDACRRVCPSRFHALPITTSDTFSSRERKISPRWRNTHFAEERMHVTAVCATLTNKNNVTPVRDFNISLFRFIHDYNSRIWKELLSRGMESSEFHIDNPINTRGTSEWKILVTRINSANQFLYWCSSDTIGVYWTNNNDT